LSFESQNLPKCVCGWGSTPDPDGGGYSTLLGSLNKFGEERDWEIEGEEKGEWRRRDKRGQNP